MTYGLQAWNTQGKFQIDDTWQGFYEVNSGTIACAGSTSIADFVDHGLTLDEEALIFARPNHTWAEIAAHNVGGELSDISMTGSYFIATYDGSIEYKVYSKTGRASAPGAGAYGLLIYDSAGNIAFSSEEYGPRIMEYTSGYPGNSSTLFTGTSSDLVPYCLMNCHSVYDHNPNADPTPAETDFSSNFWNLNAGVATVTNSFITMYSGNHSTINFTLSPVLFATMQGD